MTCPHPPETLEFGAGVDRVLDAELEDAWGMRVQLTVRCGECELDLPWAIPRVGAVWDDATTDADGVIAYLPLAVGRSEGMGGAIVTSLGTTSDPIAMRANLSMAASDPGRFTPALRGEDRGMWVARAIMALLPGLSSPEVPAS